MTNGKQKGSSFERSVCVDLSKWITNGEKIDCLWRSAMSGGRATVQKGKVRQGGDITAIAPEGHILTDKLYIECKSYKELNINCFIKGKGTLISFWEVAVKDATKYDKIPSLIFKQNSWPTMFATSSAGIQLLLIQPSISYFPYDMHLLRFDNLLKTKFPLK